MTIFLVIFFSINLMHSQESGLDLNAITKLASEVKNASELETALNKEGNVYANLDLNNDDYADYIFVQENRLGNEKSGRIIYDLFVDETKIASISYVYPTKEINKTDIIVIGHGRFHNPKRTYSIRLNYGSHPFWNRAYWNNKVYVSQYRYYKNHKRKYPKHWKKRKVVHVTKKSMIKNNKPITKTGKKNTIKKTKAKIKSKEKKNNNN